MAIFAVLNQKGGVGKTTTAVTIASALARQDYSTLLIDLDSQGNVADSLGLETGDDLRRLLSPDLRIPLDQVVTHSGRPNLDVIRSDKTTAVLKQILAGVDLREYVLADALEHANYDAIVFDCAPSVDLFHIAALVAADYIVIPTRLDKLAVNGVRDALQTLASLRRISRCQLAGIVPTFYERTTAESHLQLTAPGANLWPAGAAAHSSGYPLPRSRPCRQNTVGIRSNHPGAERFENGNGKRLGGYNQVVERIKELL